MHSYVSTNKSFLNPNMAIPCKQVDEIVITDRGVAMKDGDEYFTASWKEKQKCFPSNYVVVANINKYLDELMLPFRGEMDFSACDPSEVQDVHLCQAYKEMQNILESNSLNACEYWTPLEGYTKCQLESFTLDSISEGFQEVSLLHEAPTSPIVYEIQQESHFRANMKIPCM